MKAFCDFFIKKQLLDHIKRNLNAFKKLVGFTFLTKNKMILLQVGK
jgi:hypothetical protein